MMSATIAMKLQLNVLLPFVSDHDGMWNEEEKWRVRAGNPKKEYGTYFTYNGSGKNLPYDHLLDFW
jgi:hypothetical protein